MTDPVEALAHGLSGGADPTRTLDHGMEGAGTVARPDRTGSAPSRQAMTHKRRSPCCADEAQRYLRASGFDVVPTGGHPSVLDTWLVTHAPLLRDAYVAYIVERVDAERAESETPQTAAGRTFNAFLKQHKAGQWPHMIAAIEAEARAAGFAAGKAAGMIEGWQGIDEARAARDAEVRALPRQEDFEREIAAGLDTAFVADLIEPLESGEITLIARHLAIRCALLVRDYRIAILSDTPETGS